MKRTLLAAALLVSSVFGVTGCGSADDEAPVESRIKNSINCPHSSAKLGADESYDSLSKSFCSTPLEESYDDDDYDDYDDYDDIIKDRDDDDIIDDDIDRIIKDRDDKLSDIGLSEQLDIIEYDTSDIDPIIDGPQRDVDRD